MSDAPRGSAGWRSGESPAHEPVGPSRGARRFLAVFALLAAAGAVVGALFWIQPANPPLVLSLPVSEYTDPALPPNPWAEEDAEAVQASFPEKESSPEKAFNFQQLDRLQFKLQSLARAKSKQPVIVHLTALAAAPAGSVYILPGDALPGNPATWLPLDFLLDALASCKADHKLLLLDLAHPTANDPPGGCPGRGPLPDVVADRLDEQLQARRKAGKLPFFVLTSTSKGELSLPMDEEQKSAFMAYVADGLRGAAEAYGPDGRPDGRVRVRELAAFVTDRVGRWARDVRGLRQTPHFYGDDLEDFDLTLVSRGNSGPGEPPATKAYPGWLLAGWQRRDDWWAKGAYRTVPAAFAALQTALPRAEQEWQAVGPAERVETVHQRLDTALTKAAGAREQVRDWPPVPSVSLTTWQVPPTTPPELSSLLDAYLTSAAAGLTNPKDAEKAKEDRKAFLDKTNATPETRKAGAVLIWRRLLEESTPKAETVANLSGLLDDRQPVQTTEAAASRRLGKWQRPAGTQWPPAAARQLLHTEDAANQALASAPAAFPWTKELFAAAARRRDEGERMLFEVRDREDQRRAADILRDAETMFQTAKAQMDAVQTARRALEDAAVVLPAVAGRVSDLDATAARVAWKDAVAAALDLAERLEQPPTGRDLPLSEWESATGRLSAALQALQVPYQPASYKRLLENLSVARAAEYDALRDLLRGPLLPGTERKKVWDGAHTIAARTHKQVREADAADDESHRPPAPAKAAELPLQGEAARRERRAKVSVDVLRVAGVNTADLDATYRAALADPPKWADFAAKLRTAWVADLPKEAKVRAEKREWVAADRRERFLPPEVIRPEQPAAVEVGLQDRRAYLDWLERYYRDLGQLRKDAPNASGFYDDAAADVHRAPR
jgi:hypothetical protein